MPPGIKGHEAFHKTSILKTNHVSHDVLDTREHLTPSRDDAARRVAFQDNSEIALPRVEFHSRTMSPQSERMSSSPSVQITKAPYERDVQNTVVAFSETKQNVPARQNVFESNQLLQEERDDDQLYDFPTDFQEFPIFFEAKQLEHRQHRGGQRRPTQQGFQTRFEQRAGTETSPYVNYLTLTQSPSTPNAPREFKQDVPLTPKPKQGELTQKKENQFDGIPKRVVPFGEDAPKIPVNLDKADLDLALSLGSEGAKLLKEGKLLEAQEALTVSLNLKRKLAPGMILHDVLNNLGNCANLFENYEESLKYYQEALADVKKHDGPMSEVSHTLFNIGRVQVQRKAWDAAMPILSESWRTSREAFGENHVFVAQTLDLLGFVQFSTSEFKASLVSFKSALQIYRRIHGAFHEDVANSLCNIGLVREGRGDYENAWNMYSKARDVYELIKTPPRDPGYEGVKRGIVIMEEKMEEQRKAKVKMVPHEGERMGQKLIRKKQHLGIN